MMSWRKKFWALSPMGQWYFDLLVALCARTECVKGTEHSSSLISLEMMTVFRPGAIISWLCQWHSNIWEFNHPIFLFSVAHVEKTELSLSKISRLHMGDYLCVASNGVPPPTSKKYRIHVNCKLIYILLRPNILQNKNP